MFSRRTLLASLALAPIAGPLNAAARGPLWRDDFRHGLKQWQLEAVHSSCEGKLGIALE